MRAEFCRLQPQPRTALASQTLVAAGAMRAAALGAVHGLTGGVHIDAIDLRLALATRAIAPASGFIAATAAAVALLFDQSAHGQRNDDYDDQQNDCCSCIHGVLFSLNDAICRSVFQARMLALANITLKLEFSSKRQLGTHSH